MTEKRYKFKKENVNDFDEYGLESPILLEEDVLTFGEVIDLLNEQDNKLKKLEKENRRLIIDSLDYAGDIHDLREKILDLEDENEEMEQQLTRLYNYFQDYLADEMNGNAFSEMWDFVKEDEKWE